MAINVNEMYQAVLFTANKMRSGTLPPSRFDLFCNQAQKELFNEKVLAYVQSNKIDDDLSPFLKSVNLPVATPEGLNWGLTTRPDDYIYFSNMRAFFTTPKEDGGGLVSCGCPTSDNTACVANLPDNSLPPQIPNIPIVKEVKVRKIDGGRWDSMLLNRFKQPTTDQPYASQYDGGFKIAPRNLTIVTLDYFILPVDAHFGYIVVPNNITGVPYFQYDPITSVNLQWGIQVFDEILDRILKLYGIYLRDPLLLQSADNLKQTRV